MTGDAVLLGLVDEIRSDIAACHNADGASMKKAVDLGHKLHRAKDLVPKRQFKKWIEEQAFGVQYNWCAVCMRASEAFDQLTAAGEKYSWEYISKKTASVKELAAMRGKAGADDPWAKPPPQPRVNRLAVALARIGELEREVRELRGLAPIYRAARCTR